MRRAKHSLGFTLVELLVVISIVIALATIVWKANAGLATRNALQTQQRAFDVLGDAVAVYLEVYSDYPSQPESLQVVMDAFKDEILLRDRIAGDSEVLYEILDSLMESRHLLSRLHTGCVTDLPRSGESKIVPRFRASHPPPATPITLARISRVQAIPNR